MRLNRTAFIFLAFISSGIEVCLAGKLEEAVKNNNLKLAQILINEGGSVEQRIGVWGSTLLIEAAGEGYTDMVELLLDNGAKIEGEHEHDGKTAFCSAVFNNQFETARFLLSQGANVNAREGYYGTTALIDAAKESRRDLVQLCLNAGADINPEDREGNTALDYANYEIAKLIKSARRSKKSASSSASSTHSNFIIPFKDIKRGKFIAKGGFGSVYEGTWQGQPVAIKTLHMGVELSEDSKAEFERESKVWAELRHPNIVMLYGITIPKSLSESYCMVMALKENSLWKLLHSKRKLSGDEKQQLAIDIASALKYMHDRKTLHRDLKSLNVLVGHESKKLHGYLTDFGLTQVKNETATMSKAGSQAAAGTLLWMAPELLGRNVKYSKASDIWAYGMVLWEIATRKRPFDQVPAANIRGLIAQDTTPEIITDDIPPHISTIIQKCWNKNPKDRLSAKGILELLMNEDAGLETAQMPAFPPQPAPGMPIPTSYYS